LHITIKFIEVLRLKTEFIKRINKRHNKTIKEIQKLPLKETKVTENIRRQYRLSITNHIDCGISDFLICAPKGHVDENKQLDGIMESENTEHFLGMRLRSWAAGHQIVRRFIWLA
jgi:hypothetical protein